MARQIEINATFIRERHRFENDDCDVIIADVFSTEPSDSPSGEIENQFSIKGPSLVDELIPNQQYVFYGHWTNYTNRRTGSVEKQFAFSSFVRVQPATKDAVIAYLKSHGEGFGIGHARAVCLWNAMGSDAVKICRESPDRVDQVLRAYQLKTSLKNIEKFSQRLKADESTEQAKLSLASLLNGRSFPRNTATLAIQKWGNRASQIIQRDPYRLQAFKNCGFKRCDAMYLALGHNPTRLKRQAYCAWYSIARVNDGSTWYSIDYPKTYLKAAISGAGINIDQSMELATRGKLLSEIRTNSLGAIDSQDGTKRWFAERKNAEHEVQIASSVVSAMHERSVLWPDPSCVPGLSEHQQDELRKATQSTIGILGGSPGTGKTYTVASIVEMIGRKFGFNQIMIGTPTGKAAVRVTENLSERGIPLQARTWYSLLNKLESTGFQHFRAQFIFGDETSMNDSDLMARIFRARGSGTHLLFVGDTNQLPPVGRGAPMRDMIAAGVPFGELKEIKRNSGGIVEACAAIRDQREWKPDDNLLLESIKIPELQIKALLHWIDQAPLHGIDPVWDCQPLCAVNEKSPLSRAELNKLLQAHLNQQPGVEGMPIRLHDKLVNTENGFFPLIRSNQMSDVAINDRGEVYIANGELAKVIDIDGRDVYVELQSPHRITKFTVSKNQKSESTELGTESNEGTETDSKTKNCIPGSSFELGYVLSVHKSQGSDWPWVIPLLDSYPGAMRVCDRSWLYTAISRAKTKCILIGTKDTADRMCQSSSIEKRRTFLREQILHLNSIEQLAQV